LKAGKYFWWTSYETYCLKVSLSKKLILSQFSQKEITTIFLMKTKIEKHKKRRKILPTVCLPQTYLKKMSLTDLFWGGNEKSYDFWLNLAICQNLFSLIIQSTNQLVPFFFNFYIFIFKNKNTYF